ncbi:MAG: hypothetical protein VX951_05845 [Planctomycetota bacterium]|nr:hypothetical protein [Planctomycetota bacterium]
METSRAQGTTKNDGRFSIRIRTSVHDQLELHTRSRGYADMQGPVSGNDDRRSAGDIMMPEGAFLVGHVEDETGAPQPEISLRLFRNTPERQTGIRPTTWFKLTSDATGSLTSDLRLACQGWRLSPADDGVRIVKPAANFEVTGGSATQYLTVVVRMPDPKAMIRGHIVDEDDKPVARAIIHAMDKDRWPVGFGYSKPDGRFTVRCRKDPSGPVHLTVPHAKGYEKLLSKVPFDWGTDNVKLVMERAGGVRIIVVEAVDGRPVEHFQVIWYQAYKPGAGAPQQGHQPALHHPKGEATIEGIPRGPARLIVIPTDEGLVPNDPIEFVKSTDSPDIRVTLAARVGLEVRVTDTGGRPIAGTVLELLQPGDGSTVTASTNVFDHEKSAQLAFRIRDRVLRLDRTQTDEQGIGVLGWQPSQNRLAVRVLGPGHVPVIRDGVFLAKDKQRLEITVQAGAKLLGQLQPLDVIKQLGSGAGNSRWPGFGPRITLEFVGKSPTSSPAAKVSAVRPDGSFEFDGLMPGIWEIQFSAVRFINGRSSNAGQKLLGRIDLSNGGTRRATYDISDLRPASVRGRVILNSVVATQTDIQLAHVQEAWLGRQAGGGQALRTDDNGNFRAEGVSPGKYVVSVDAPGDGPRRPRLTSTTMVSVPPGANISQDFYIQAGSLRVRLLNSGGTPAAKRNFQVTSQTTHQIIHARSDADGILAIKQISVGTYAIKTLAKNPSVETGPTNPFGITRRGRFIEIGKVTVTAGSDSTTVQLTLPAK